MNIRPLARVILFTILSIAVAACGRGDPASFIASARSYMAKSDYGAAIIELKNALKDAPDNPEARFLLAKALLESGNPGAAETEVRKALELRYSQDDAYPVLAQALFQQGEFKKAITELANRQIKDPQARADVLTVLGLAHLRLGQTKEARTAIEGALALQPTNLSTRIAEVRLKVQEHDLPGAFRLLDAVVSSAPGNVEALLLMADVQDELGKRDDVVKSLERAIEIKPSFVVPRLALIRTLVRQGQLDKASTQLDSVKKIAPNDPRTLHAEALVALARGNPTAAREAIVKVTQVTPDYLPSRYLSGLIDYQLGSYATAEESLRTVVAKVPGDDGARRALAATYLRRGRALQAQETLEPLLRRTPDDPVLLRMEGEVNLALNNPAKAAQYFERANALDKGNVTTRVRLAQVRLATGDAGGGFKDLEALAATEPKQTEPDLALISAYLRRKDYEKALAAALALEKKQPTNPATHNIKGVVYMAKRDLANARASFEKAVALDPGYTSGAFNLGRLDVSQGNFDAARKRYEQILAKEPKNELALLALAELLALTKAPQGDVKAALERAIAANPLSVRPRLTLVSFYGQLRDWPAALAAAQAARSALPDNAQVVEALAATQLAAGETNQAIASLRKAAVMQPENSAPLVRLADLQVKSKDYDGAIGSLRNALAVQPDNSGIPVALADVYVQSGRIDAGIADAKKLQKERPDRAAGYVVEGEILTRQKKWNEALSAYRAALGRKPSTFVVVRLHSTLLAAGKPDEAAALTQKWLKEHSNDVTLRFYLAQLSLSRNDYRGAVPHLRAVLETDSENVAVLNNLAWSLGELGDASALEYAEKANMLAPNAAATVDTYGWVLVRYGDVKRGVEVLRKAVGLAPNDPEIRLHLAKGLIKAGDKEAARKELETLSKLDTPSTARTESESLLKRL